MIKAAAARGSYKHHSLAFKQALVEASLRLGAPVARIAREHGINANQPPLWRKTYRAGAQGKSMSALLPAKIEQQGIAERLIATPPGGCLRIETELLRPHIEGRPDPETLRIVLAALRRPG